MLRPVLTALLGLALCLAGGTFDMASLYVPGVGLVLLAVGSVVWVWLAARGASVARVPGPHTVVEEEPPVQGRQQPKRQTRQQRKKAPAKPQQKKPPRTQPKS